jgi:AcrR family transcriptional regulator
MPRRTATGDHPARTRNTVPPPKPGRPRSEKARNAILDAAVDLLLTRELAAVSMDALADRAGVSKATIYRWWATKETLALDALYHEWATAGELPPATGSLRNDLYALLGPWVDEIKSRPYDAVIATLFAKTRTDPQFAQDYLERLVEPRRARARVVFIRAHERGEIAEGVDIEVAIDLIYGPLYLRLLQGHAPLSRGVVGRVIDVVLDGVLARAEKETSHG